jgi:hypothetical protein
MLATVEPLLRSDNLGHALIRPARGWSGGRRQCWLLKPEMRKVAHALVR